ncbi:unnamed protein product [Fusarium graminearum]|nr:unnamed protein product [Fusarium graminearum]
MPSLGCGTCRARKVRCDQTLPKCNRCIKAGRDCEGYGLRLSWPRHNDKRRAMVGPHSKTRSKGIPLNHHRLVNASSRDMELHQMISKLAQKYSVGVDAVPDTPIKLVEDTILARQARQATPFILLNSPATGVLAELSPTNKILFQYFVERASYSISTFGKDAQRVPKILIRMALSDNTPSSTAVLRSSIALASSHRDNEVYATARSKVAALRALAKSLQGFIGVSDSACHIGAGIILSTLEVQQSSTTSSHWLWYACGAAKLVKTSGLDEITTDRDMTSLVGWVHYFNTMAKFSLRHWKPNFVLDYSSLVDAGFNTFHPAVCSNGQPANLTGYPHEILYLLTEVFNSVTVASDPRSNTSEYIHRLQTLDCKLQSIAVHTTTGLEIDNDQPEFNMAVELYRLSTLIYLRRASAGILDLNKNFIDWVDQAFVLLAHLPTCQWAFPLFIFGCEARDDARRLILLDLIQRTADDGRYRSLAPIKRLIEIMWVQQDLLDDDLDYVCKLGVILSSSQKSVPAFLYTISTSLTFLLILNQLLNMPSYLITGTSRGLGFEFVRQLSADPNNTVIGFARNKQATEEKIEREMPGRSNIHTIQGEIENYESVKNLIDETAKITGGSLDYIIANAAIQSEWSGYNPIGALGSDPEKLEQELLDNFKINTVGNVHLFNLALPLIREGQAKKIIGISSGHADPDFITNFSIVEAAPYSMSKGALNIAIAKFDAQYRKEGILFMAISPGVVATKDMSNVTEEQLKGFADMMAAFQVYAPNFTGPISPEESVQRVMSVVYKASIESGSGGQFVSHFGTKQWL